MRQLTQVVHVQICGLNKPAQLCNTVHARSLERVTSALDGIINAIHPTSTADPEHPVLCFLSLPGVGLAQTVDDIHEQVPLWPLVNLSDWAAIRQYTQEKLMGRLDGRALIHAVYICCAAVLHDELRRKDAYKDLSPQMFVWAICNGGLLTRTEYFGKVSFGSAPTGSDRVLT